MTRKLRKLKRLLKGKIIDLYGDIHDLSSFSVFNQHHHPCVVSDIFNNWPALKHWQPPWLRIMELILPASKIRVALSHGSFSGKSQEFADISFFEFLTLSSFEKINCYMAQCPMKSNEGLSEETSLSRLLQDIKKVKIIPSDVQMHLWMNIKKVESEFHYDSYENFLCVVNGEKVVELIPPGDLVKAERLEKEAYNHAENGEKYGEFMVRVKKGQALYIPEGWWHRVVSKINTVAVSMTWKGIDQKVLALGNFY